MNMEGAFTTEGCSVILQKGSILKHCKVMTSRPQFLGKNRESMSVSFDTVIGEPFGSTFKMISSNAGKNKYTLQKQSWQELQEGSLQLECESGSDNRNLTDDGTSQKLSQEDIRELKSSGASGEQVIQAITDNSATFSSKTKYSQEKYIKKKGKKYSEPVILHNPSIDLVADMLYSQEPWKISNLRPDTLLQALLQSNAAPGGRAAVCESGTMDLVTAGLLHRVGSTGVVVHVYVGGKPLAQHVKSAVEMMNFTDLEMQALTYISINRLHSIKPTGKPDTDDSQCLFKEPVVENLEDGQLPVKTGEDDVTEQPSTRSRKFCRSRAADESHASRVLSEGLTTLVVACKQHPMAAVLTLLPFLLPGHPFVVFCPYVEPLLELYQELKSGCGTNLRLSETWLREYQVLPERTHPAVNMSGGGGYLLCGTKIIPGQQDL